MVYVMSDIHGEYEKYCAMLDQIEFCEEDELYVLGDVLDRGPEPVKILKDMASRANVYPIMGNHEWMALDILEDLFVEITESNYDKQIDDDLILKLMDWQKNGGGITMQKFQELPKQERYDLLDYLKEFSPFEVVDAGEKTYILVHSGLGNFAKGKRLRDYTLQELVFSRADYSAPLFDDKDLYLVVGHTPTLEITGKAEIFCANQYICIDCGASFGGRLACLRLEDGKVFYVE